MFIFALSKNNHIMNTEKLSVKKGIERLAKVYCWPNDPAITDMDKYEFRALGEFVLFKEYVMNPFFKSLLGFLFKNIAKLYQHLSTLPMDKTCMLTYKEAFLLMRYLGDDKVKLILEQTSYPSNVYNGIIRSLEEDNYDLFFSALDKSDYTKMMQVLWVMRHILYGEKKDWNAIDPSTPHLTLLPYLPRWINNIESFKPYFMVNEDDNEEKLIDERVIEIVKGRLRKHRRQNRNLSSTNNHNDNLGEDNKKVLESLFEESLFKSQWNDLLTEFSDNSDLHIRNIRVNTSYIEDLARLILTHNVILHKDYIMEKYGIDSSEIYNQFRNTDVYTYEGGDCKDFGRYILYYTWEMLYIYNKVENILDDDLKKVLRSILYRSRSTTLLESVASFSASKKMDDLQNTEKETIGLVIPTPIVQEMAVSLQTGDNVSNSNNCCFEMNAIVLNFPRLHEKYRDKYCASMAKRGAGCTKEMIEYYLWGANKVPQNAISKDTPLVWTGTRQLLVAYIRFLYLVSDSKQRIPSITKKRLESSVILDGKPLKYVSIDSDTLEKDISDIKNDIDWNEEDSKNEKVVNHEKFR